MGIKSPSPRSHINPALHITVTPTTSRLQVQFLSLISSANHCGQGTLRAHHL